MKIHDVKQGEEEWIALRRQYFTGSALGEWLIDGDRTKTSRKAWSNAIWAKLGELSQDDEPKSSKESCPAPQPPGIFKQFWGECGTLSLHGFPSLTRR